MNTHQPLKSHSSKTLPSLKTIALLLSLVLSSSSIVLAQSSQNRGNTPWRPIAMRSNLPGNTIAIAASPESQNFLAVASDETGGSDYSIFGLDHNQLEQGWSKVTTLSLPGSVNDLIFGDHHFFVTGTGDRGAFVAVSSDTVGWDVAASTAAIPFVGVGSDGSEHTAFLFPLSATSSEYVTIGDSHFWNHPRLSKKFTAMTVNNEMFVAIASDGDTSITYSKSK